MNYHSINKAILLILSTTISACVIANNQTIQERSQNIIKTYDLIMKKWEPALSNLSEKSLWTIIKNQEATWTAQSRDAISLDEEETFKTLISNMLQLPFNFICEDLDADIKTIASLQQEAAILNTASDMTLDIALLQNLRVKIDTLPCLLKEKAQLATLAKTYKKVILGLASCGIGYYIYNQGASFGDIVSLIKEQHPAYVCLELVAITTALYALLNSLAQDANDSLTQSDDTPKPYISIV